MAHTGVDYLPRIRALKEQLGFDFTGIAFRLNTNHSLLTWMYATGNLNNRYRRIVLESGKGIAGGVHKTGRAMIIQDALREIADEKLVQYPIIISERLASMFALPLWKNNEVHGVLLMAFRSSHRISKMMFCMTLESVGAVFLRL